MHSMIIEKNCLKAFCKFSLIRALRKELKCWKTKSFLIIFPFCSACLLGLGSLPSTTYNFFVNFSARNCTTHSRLKQESGNEEQEIPTFHGHSAWCWLENYWKHYVKKDEIILLMLKASDGFPKQKWRKTVLCSRIRAYTLWMWEKLLSWVKEKKMFTVKLHSGIWEDGDSFEAIEQWNRNAM